MTIVSRLLCARHKPNFMAMWSASILHAMCIAKLVPLHFFFFNTNFKHPKFEVFSSYSAIKLMQVADCCMCRWFSGSINLCQQRNNADIPYWDTSWAGEAHERGRSLNQIKACVLLKSENQHPSEDAVGIKLHTSPWLYCLHFYPLRF